MAGGAVVVSIGGEPSRIGVVYAPGSSIPVVDALNDAVIVAELTGEIVFANLATESLLGWKREDLIGGPLSRLVPERLLDAHSVGIARFAGGAPGRIIGQPTRVPALRADGHEVAIELLLSILPAEDGAEFVVGTMRDVRERVDLERDSTLTHHVLDVVSGSTGSPDAVVHLLSAVATSLGWQAAGLWEPAGDDPALVCTGFWAEDLRADALAEASADITFAPGIGLPGRVWANGQPAWITELVGNPNFPRAAAATASGLACGLAFPLQDGDTVVGVMELFRTTAAAPEPALLDVLHDVGSSLGPWLARSRLQQAYDDISRRERQVADTLRRTLLPPTLPRLDQIVVAAAFVPGGDISVGGDFYDAIPIPGDRLAVVIGDVCGSGPEAAAVSGQVRHSFRALADTLVSPGALCDRLNMLLCASRNDNRFCTAVIGVLSAAGDRLDATLSAAGHPPPIIIRAQGAVEVVPVAGTLLGVVPFGRWPEAEVQLVAGDVLVLYTDGVVEARSPGGPFFGEQRLLALCEELRGQAPEQIVAAIRDAAMTHAGQVVDDIAVLAVAPGG